MVPAVMFVQTAAQIAFQQMHHERRMQAAELNAEAARLSYKEKELDIAFQRDQMMAQKEVAMAIVDAALHVFDKKMEAFTDAYNKFHSLIQERQQTLLDEQKALMSQICDPTTPDARAADLISQRTALCTELNDIEKLCELMNREFNERISALNLELNLSTLPLLT
jgi:hypothetical protein